MKNSTLGFYNGRINKHCFWILLMVCFSVGTMQINAQSSPCNSEAHRQFDFWIGDWMVFHSQADTIVGYNKIERILNGCVIMENWTGATGFEGKSFNTFNAIDSTWNQTWVDVSGATYQFKGRKEDGAMKMKGNTVNAQGQNILFEMTYTPDIATGNVRQIWKQSSDNGKNWTRIFDGIYKKKKQ